jgi:hypothetical protein
VWLVTVFPASEFFFVATMAPILLAAALSLIFGILRGALSKKTDYVDLGQDVRRVMDEEGEARSGHSAASQDNTEVPPVVIPMPPARSGSANRSNDIELSWAPTWAHVHIACLDQTCTLLAVAGGFGTPGEVQAVINQSIIPLAAVFSFILLRRRFNLG